MSNKNKIILDEYQFKLEDLSKEYQQLNLNNNYKFYEFKIDDCHFELSELKIMKY